MSHDLLFTNETAWNAIDLRALFDQFGAGVLGEGDLEVTAGATGLSVDVAAGSALVESDEAGDQGKYRVVLDTPLNSAAFTAGGLEAADATDPRIDRIVARVYDDEVDGSGLTAFRLEVVTGTPTAGADLTNDDGIGAIPTNALELARVLVEATDTAVDPLNVADDRVFGGAPSPGPHGSSHEQDSTDPIPSLPTADEKDAMTSAATAPTGANPFVTEADLPTGGDGPVIADESTPLTQRPTVAFEGAGVTASDDSGGSRTVVTIPGGGAETLPVSIIDAAGDLIVGTGADAADNLAAGGEESVLVIDSAVPAWTDPKNVLPLRTSVGFNTSNLANNASDATITLGLEPSARAIMLEADRACRFRLYMTSADRTADAARAIGTDPTGDHGLLLEVVTTGAQVVRLTPQVDMSADPAGDLTRPFATSYYVSVTNLSGATHVVNLTLTYIPTERR